MPRMMFVNLPVKHLASSVAFYEAIGCKKNEMISNEETIAMAWSDTITFMLMPHARFASFASKSIATSDRACAAIFGLSQETRDGVDAVATAAAAAGGRTGFRDPQDLGFMYQRAIEDPDGNAFELVWMDPTAFSGGGD